MRVMMSKAWARVIGLVCVLVGFSAQATTVRLYTEDEMVQAATAIVRGHVTQVTSRWHPSGVIITEVTLHIDRALKGARGQDSVTLTQLGGTVGDKKLVVSGTTTFAVGEEVVVFLETGGGGLVEMGVGAGKFAVTQGVGGPTIKRQLGHLSFATVKGRAASPAAPPPTASPEPLATFERRILAAIARTGTKP